MRIDVRGWTRVALVATAIAAGADPARAADGVLVEDWARHAVGAHGVPDGWRKYETVGGRPAYDFTVVQDGGIKALRLRSRDDHSTIARDLSVDLARTPVLEWSWKIVTLPAGADVRRRETSDLTAHVFLVWPRMPALIRSRLIGYTWDGVLPAGAVERSRKTRTVAFVAVRSGMGGLGSWVTEQRNVVEDYRRLYGEAPDNPPALALSIDTNDTRTLAEGLIGAIRFVAAPPR